MSSRLPRRTAKEVEEVLSKHGFELVAQKGSHRKWRNAHTRIVVTVPFHAGKALPIGTLVQIQKSSQIARKEWE
jgi:predicted RNA binding protein YcfA (HicA-like mRNA interferase family)